MAIIGAAIIALAGAAVLVTAAISPSGSKAEPVIVQVNGEPVAEPEFRLYMDKEKGAVTNYFSVAYQAEDSEKYWTTEYGGETPLNRLKKQALEEAVRGKVLLLFAQEKGLAESASFEDIEKEWEENNASREQSIKRNKAVFGLGRYELSQYYFYYLSNLKLKLEELLGKEELTVSDEELRQVYFGHAAEYANRTRVIFEELSIPYPDGEKEKAKEKSATILGLLEAGMSFPEAAARHADGEPREHSFIEGEPESPLQAEALLKQAATRLKEGEYSPALDTGSGFSIIRLLKREAGYSVPLESVEAQLRAEALHLKFEQYLEKLAQEAQADIVTKNYVSLSETAP
ncbi:peptidylprolyl isomerase [Cohnella thailandensis]|uniref:Peptidyl-prolyl cis-trans isomerase n=1 Tax=Cohnella thailandensis TaxID=557557 RepID=A0A841T3D2_9BACL|nr:peptidylprolyl isomerase [Cohnella thailandensis]MBB6637125.1 peptidyl-prolyl cis-trans isomerase [Cohnella thailandensis]